MATVRDCTTSLFSDSTVVAKRAVLSLYQAHATLVSAHALLDEEGSIEQLSLQCEKLTSYEVQENSMANKFTEMLDSILHRDNTIVLHTRHDVLLPVECKVHEYLAASRLLSSHHRCDLSRMLQSAFDAIVQTSHTLRYLSPLVEVRMFDNAYTLIESTMFRSKLIREAVHYQLKPYVDIQEMLQIFLALQRNVDDMATVDLQTCIQLDITATEQGKMPDTALLVRMLNITDIIHDQVANLYSLSSDQNVNLQRLPTAMHNAVNTTGILVDYGVLRVTQVFIALAVRKYLHYEMQHSFDDIAETKFDIAEQYMQHTSLQLGADKSIYNIQQLVQLRMAHAIRTYYMYYLLEEFVYGILAPGLDTISADTSLQLHEYTRIYAALLQPDIMDMSAIAMSIRLTESIYAAILVHSISQYDEGDAYQQIQHYLNTMSDQLKINIIHDTLQYVFDSFAPHCITVKLGNSVTLTQHDTDIVHCIVDKINPINDNHGVQLMHYLSLQLIQILKQLPDSRFNEIRSNIKPCLVNVGNLWQPQLNRRNLLALNALTIQEVQHNIHSITQPTITYVINLMSHYLLTTYDENAYDIMHDTMHRIIVEAHKKFDLNALEASDFYTTCTTHTLHVTTHTILLQIYHYYTNNVWRFGVCTLVAACSFAARAVYNVFYNSTQQII